MKIPALLKVFLAIAVVYAGLELVFAQLLGQPIPASLMTMYMFFVVIGVLMAATFTEQGAAELVAPIRALVEDPTKKPVRNVVFAIAPLLAAGFTYYQATPRFEAPLELRAIHPAPPSSIELYGKRYDLLTLENPYRRTEKEDPERFRGLVAEGARVYVENCHFCHGDKLDGQGPYAQGLNPSPLSFQDIGTIAQLQESFVFWRIATGGPGLPDEAGPWISAMPVWKDFLTEDEIWKVILFLYDYTGHRPRSWEAEG